MSKHKELVKDCEKSIEQVFSDTSVSQERTLADLEALRTELDFKIEAIKADLKRMRERRSNG